MADIPGDGSEWNINGSQFIRAKMQGSEAFYSIDLGIDHDSGLFVLLVSCYILHFENRSTSHVYELNIEQLFLSSYSQSAV